MNLNFVWCLMLISSDAEKQNQTYWILSDVNIIRCRKTEQKIPDWILSDVRHHQMQKNRTCYHHWMSCDAFAEKKLSWLPLCYRTTAINEYSLMLILSDAGALWVGYRTDTELPKNQNCWSFSEQFCLMLISSDAAGTLNLLMLHHQMQ